MLKTVVLLNIFVGLYLHCTTLYCIFGDSLMNKKQQYLFELGMFLMHTC